MSTWITIEVEVGVDVPQDALGMWIAEQLNHPRETAERSEEEEAGLEALDDYQGPVTVMWWIRSRRDHGHEQSAHPRILRQEGSD